MPKKKKNTHSFLPHQLKDYTVYESGLQAKRRFNSDRGSIINTQKILQPVISHEKKYDSYILFNIGHYLIRECIYHINIPNIQERENN